MSTVRIDPRTLALAKGAAERARDPLADLFRIRPLLPLDLRREIVALVEQFDVVRFALTEATLATAIHGGAAPRKVGKNK